MSAAAPAFTYDVFISRCGSVAAVARGVGDILGAEGYNVVVQDCDIASRGQFVLDIDAALKLAHHLLIRFCYDYHSSFWTQQKFGNWKALAANPVTTASRSATAATGAVANARYMRLVPDLRVTHDRPWYAQRSAHARAGQRVVPIKEIRQSIAGRQQADAKQSLLQNGKSDNLPCQFHPGWPHKKGS
jgi:hypothetical protein